MHEGSTPREIAADHPIPFMKFHAGITKLFQYRRQTLVLEADRAPPIVVLHYGPTGCGKTRLAFAAGTPYEIWPVPLTGAKWFDGYIGQPIAIIDEFVGRASKFPLAKVLRLLDRYRLQVPVKGGFTYFNPTVVYVTTNIHPSRWYDYSDRRSQYAALVRRFTRVECFDDLVESVGFGGGFPATLPGFRQKSLNPVSTPNDWAKFWVGPLQMVVPVLGPLDLWVERNESEEFGFMFNDIVAN